MSLSFHIMSSSSSIKLLVFGREDNTLRE